MGVSRIRAHRLVRRARPGLIRRRIRRAAPYLPCRSCLPYMTTPPTRPPRKGIRPPLPTRRLSTDVVQAAPRGTCGRPRGKIRGIPAPHTPRHEVLEWRYHTLRSEKAVD